MGKLLDIPAWVFVAASILAAAVAVILVFVAPGVGLVTPMGFFGRPEAGYIKLTAGHWNGEAIDNQNLGSLVTASRPNWYAIRLDFTKYNYSTPPILILTSGEGTRSFIESINTKYADIKNQAFTSTYELNGKQSPEQQFWFVLIPTDR